MNTTSSCPKALKNNKTGLWFVRGRGFTGRLHERTFHTPDEIAGIRHTYACKFTAYGPH